MFTFRNFNFNVVKGQRSQNDIIYILFEGNAAATWALKAIKNFQAFLPDCKKIYSGIQCGKM